MLHDLMAKYGSDKAPHGFCEFYEKWFGPVRQDVKSVLEIGIADGASIRGFLDYFPNARVYGLDVPRGRDFVGLYGDMNAWPVSARFTGLLADQANRAHLNNAVQDYGPWDIVIDDGGHTMEQQQVSLGVLFPHTCMFYVVEDLHTSFMDEITIYDPNGPKRSYPTGAADMLTTYDYLKTLHPDAHIFDRDADHKHMTAVLVKEDAE